MNLYDPDLHVYRGSKSRLPGATDVIKSQGLVDTTWLSEEARWRGKCVHKGVELLVKGELDWDTVDAEHLGYLRSAETFLETTGFEVVGAEMPCFDLAFGCLPDLWGRLNGHNAIIELKTGAVPGWAALQTALQARALRTDKRFFASRRFALRLLPSGGMSRLVPFEDDRDEHVAMSMVELFHWRLQHGYFKWEN